MAPSTTGVIRQRRQRRCIQAQSKLLTEQARLLKEALRCGNALAVMRLPSSSCRSARPRRHVRRTAPHSANEAPRKQQYSPAESAVVPNSGLESVFCSSLARGVNSRQVGAINLANARSAGRPSWLDPDDLLTLMFRAGLRGDDPEWMIAFDRLCNEQGLDYDAAGGVSSATFIRLVMDELICRCQKTSSSLQDMLKVMYSMPGSQQATSEDVEVASSQRPAPPAVEATLGAAYHENSSRATTTVVEDSSMGAGSDCDEKTPMSRRTLEAQLDVIQEHPHAIGTGSSAKSDVVETINDSCSLGRTPCNQEETPEVEQTPIENADAQRLRTCSEQCEKADASSEPNQETSSICPLSSGNEKTDSLTLKVLAEIDAMQDRRATTCIPTNDKKKRGSGTKGKRTGPRFDPVPVARAGSRTSSWSDMLEGLVIE